MHKLVGAALAFGTLAACGGHYHGHYAPPPRYVDYHHYHRLDCDHLVECHYRRGRHHYRPHRNHDSYWHVHRTPAGHYKRCYVERRRHRSY